MLCSTRFGRSFWTSGGTRRTCASRPSELLPPRAKRKRERVTPRARAAASPPPRPSHAPRRLRPPRPSLRRPGGGSEPRTRRQRR
eukprot:11732103-Alexandrium_andersonii.AAC.1